MNARFDLEKAKKGLLELKTKLTNLHKSVTESKAPTREEVKAWHTEYHTLPITFAVNWTYADIDEKQMQKLADEVRDKLNAAIVKTGMNTPQVRRAFNAS